MFDLVLLGLGTLAGLLVNHSRQTLKVAEASDKIVAPAGKISVIIPAYNEEVYIEQTLNSILNQNLYRKYPDMVEIIVVDNESTDRTAEIASQYTTVISAPRGKLNAKNAGAAIASGDILVFTDADAVLKPNWLNLLVRHFQNPEVVGVSGPIHEDVDIVRMAIQLQLSSYNSYLTTVMAGANQAVRRDVFFAVGGFPTDCDQFNRSVLRHHEEIEFCSKLKEYGRIVYDTQATAFFSGRSLKCAQCASLPDNHECIYCATTPLQSDALLWRG